MPYQVITPVFEGPLDLLLHLITRQQVDLWDVSVSSIVDDYVATLTELRAGLDLEVATEFLLVAALLLELKARRLLPGGDDVEPDEELGLWEERDLLLARLLEAKTFKDASLHLGRLMDSASRSLARRAGLEERFVGLTPDLLAGVAPGQLRDVLAGLLTPAPAPRVDLDHVAPVRLSVADAVGQLVKTLPVCGRITFRALTAGDRQRLEVIVAFLAVLELYKQGLVDLEQASTFGDLHVTWTGGAGGDGGDGGADGDSTQAPGALAPGALAPADEYRGW
ncbi:MAG: segregation and condensation protein A [Acidimicrobiales bacterium]